MLIKGGELEDERWLKECRMCSADGSGVENQLKYMIEVKIIGNDLLIIISSEHHILFSVKTTSDSIVTINFINVCTDDFNY